MRQPLFKRRNRISSYTTAVIYDRGGRVLAVGENSFHKTHPMMWQLARGTFNPHRVYLHAEVDAIIKATNRGLISKAHKIVVTRVKCDGTFGNAKPCDLCSAAIAKTPIKIIEHT